MCRTVASVLFVLGAALVVACGPAVPTPPAPSPVPVPATNPSSAEYPGITASTHQPLATPCTWASGVLTANLNPNETATFTLDVSGNLVVNGVACGAATAANTTRFNIGVSPDVGGSEVVILDFSNGLFGTVPATSQGIFIALGSGAGDAVQVVGTPGPDTFVVGTSGATDIIALNTDTTRDVTVSGAESITLSGGNGDDVLSGQGVLYNTGSVAARPLLLYGGAGNDHLRGGNADDQLFGGAGDDTLTESGGNDTASGEAGNDLFDEGTASNGSDTLIGGTETDTVSYAGRTAAVTVTIGAAANDGEPGEGDDVRSDVEIVTGGGAADTLSCEASTGCTLNGGPGDDWLIGRAGNDVLNGEAGHDVLQPGAGNDTVNGGAGTDTVTYADHAAAVTVTLGAPGVGSTGNGSAGESDTIDLVENVTGGAGNDTLTGNALDNRLAGGPGNDVLNGGLGNDTFDEGLGANGSDIFNGGGGTDTVDYSGRSGDLTVTMDGVAANDGEAGEGDDVMADVENLLAGAGNDVVTGNASDNALDGGSGNDTLNGLAGNDELTGGAGDDTLNGGTEDDMIDPGPGSNTIDCGAGFDTLLPGGTWATPPVSCELY